jgi:hypothetical protein
MVSHYAGLAPLKAVTEDFKDKSTSAASSSICCQSALQRQLESTATNIEALLLREAALELAIDDMRAENTCSYIMNSCSQKWHLASQTTSGTSSSTWKSPCGWHYGVSSFSTARQIPDTATSSMLCERCLPELRSQRRLYEAEEQDTASSSE